LLVKAASCSFAQTIHKMADIRIRVLRKLLRAPQINIHYFIHVLIVAEHSFYLRFATLLINFFSKPV